MSVSPACWHLELGRGAVSTAEVSLGGMLDGDLLFSALSLAGEVAPLRSSIAILLAVALFRADLTDATERITGLSMVICIGTRLLLKASLALLAQVDSNMYSRMALSKNHRAREDTGGTSKGGAVGRTYGAEGC